MKRILFLYTELAPYFVACVEALVKDHDVEVHIVRWPVNKEAPFQLKFPERVHVYERDAYDELPLFRLANGIDPDIVFASGWVDKDYLKVCRSMRKRGKPVVMCSDTAWRGDLRQWAAVGTSRFWLRRTFSHAWVTGEAQATYARFLGFPPFAIKRGFYSADVERFAPLATRFEASKKQRFPHRFLCVARYIPTKGHQLICDAFAGLCDADQAGDWELWFIGTGELEQEVKNSTCGKHLRIKHIGFVQADEMHSYLEHTGVFILASTYEPWGVVVHEHAVAGFPLILSDAVGAADRFLKEGYNGMRFNAGDKESLQGSLRKFIGMSDDELRQMSYASTELGKNWSPKQWAQVAMELILTSVDKPQVLVFIDWYTPGYKAGGPVRSVVNMVDHLRDRIDFHIVTSDTEYTNSTPYAGITPDRWTELPGGEKVWYASRTGFTTGAWKQLLSEREWDTVYINGMYSRWFSIMPLRLLRGSGQRRVVAVRGMLAPGMMKHGRLKKRLFLTMMKLFGNYRGVEFQATNAAEAIDVKHWISTEALTHVVPNLARRPKSNTPPLREKKAGELRLVSVARIAVEKNTLFAIQCLSQSTALVVFDLYGPIYDQVYWQRCQDAIAELPPNVSVRYNGTIEPDRVQALFNAHHALFMPSQGENFGHTMVEALAAGLPLLVSDRTPWRGLRASSAGWDLPLDEPAGFLEALNELAGLGQVDFDRLSAGAFALGARYLGDPRPIEQSFVLLTQR